MAKFKPVTITNGSFIFCRATIAILLWISIALQIKWLVFIVFAVMLFSAIFKVERAPLILLYHYTVDKIWPSEKVIVDEKGIYVSHIVGTFFSALCLILLYFANPIIAWIVTVLFALLQTSAAFGFCSAMKLYTCLTGNGNCCRFGRLAKRARDRHV